MSELSKKESLSIPRNVIQDYLNPETRSSAMSELEKITESFFIIHPTVKGIEIPIGGDTISFTNKNLHQKYKSVFYVKTNGDTTYDSQWNDLKNEMVAEKKYDGNIVIEGVTHDGTTVKFFSSRVDFKVDEFKVFSEIDNANVTFVPDAKYKLQEYVATTRAKLFAQMMSMLNPNTSEPEKSSEVSEDGSESVPEPKPKISNIDEVFGNSDVPPSMSLEQIVQNGKRWLTPEFTDSPLPEGSYYLYAICPKMKRVVPVLTKKEGIQYLFEFLDPQLYCVSKNSTT